MNNKNIAPAVALQKTAVKQNSLLTQPVASVEQITKAWNNYQELKSSLLNQNDYQDVKGKKYIKKSGWRKIQTAFGISDELIGEERKDFDKYFVYEITIKVSAQNGRFSFGVGSCASSERAFAHTEHDVRSTAHTRAKNRAISDLVGGGEVSAEEMISQDNNDIGKENNNEQAEDLIEEQRRIKYSTEEIEEDLITEKQKSYITDLIFQQTVDDEERNQKLAIVDGLSKWDASELISKLLPA